jgi:UrcA family protein
MNGKKAVMALGMAAGFCLVGSNATTNAATPDSAERASISVSLADLDLGTKAGADAATARINSAAKKLCRRFADDRKVSGWATFVDCYRATTAEVFRRLDAGTRAAQSTTGRL